jgi:AcrR family transcriptional regulator
MVVLETDAKPKYGNPVRRAQLLDAVSEYLDQVGLVNFSYRGAARAAGVTTVTLGRYFENRDGLLDALLEDATQNLLSRVRAETEVMAGDSLLVGLRRLIEDNSSYLYDLDWAGAWRALSMLASTSGAPLSMRQRYLRAFEAGREFDIDLMRGEGVPPARARVLGTTFYSFMRGVFGDHLQSEDIDSAREGYRAVLRWLEMELASVDRCRP